MNAVRYEENSVLQKLPAHLRQFINEQDYEAYSPIDQAVWRYVMRKNVNYFKHIAHESYIQGLKKTGISTEEIPSMYGMNRILKNIGWAAVAVDGFIPPQAFMEFQAYNVLVISEDIRQLKQIEYTPAPDIIHEAAGHAPIIAHPEYAEYLRRFGDLGGKAISSVKDHELYEAIRHLSIVKEDVEATEKEIQEAEESVHFVQKNRGTPSEMSRIRTLHWWTVEYGLIGTLEEPKIYGAGLLSSIGESSWCMGNEVKKMPYTIDAANVEFDITKPQPQLFVTPDFAHLSHVLEQFADGMALRKGGAFGLQKLVDSQNIGTVEYSSGLQISGIFSRVIVAENNQPAYLQTHGKTALSYRDKELIGHGTLYHKEGFGSPVGKLKGSTIAMENISPHDLDGYHLSEGQRAQLTFESGVQVEGEVITGKRDRWGKILLISFKNCTVRYGEEILFRPEWGIYDMAIGLQIVSAYAGPADHTSFNEVKHMLREKTRQRKVSPRQKVIETYYQQVRAMRHNKVDSEELMSIVEKIKEAYPEEWLILIEIYELLKNDLAQQVKQYLLSKKHTQQRIYHLIEHGIAIVEKAKIHQVTH